MTKNEQAQSWDRVISFIHNDSDLTTDQLRSDLVAQGYDVDAFLKRINETVRKGLQYQIQRKALAERQEIIPIVNIAEILAASKETLLGLMKQFQDGLHGDEARGIAVALCRNKNSEEQTEAELRSQIIDILSTVQQRDSQK